MSADMRHLLSAFHLAVSSNAVEVRYAVVRFNRVGIKPTFCYCLLKRTSRLLFYHNLVSLGGGPNFRWQYTLILKIVQTLVDPVPLLFQGLLLSL